MRLFISTVNVDGRRTVNTFASSRRLRSHGRYLNRSGKSAGGAAEQDAPRSAAARGVSGVAGGAYRALAFPYRK